MQNISKNGLRAHTAIPPTTVIHHKRQCGFLLLGLVAVFIIGGGQFYYLLLMPDALSQVEGITSQFKLVFPVFFFIFTLLTLARYWLIMFFAFLETSKIEAFNDNLKIDTPKVSILVPAHNEEHCIVETLQSLISVDFPNLEILLVDDGSTDNTYAQAEPFAGMHDDKIIKIFRKHQGGKASALNLAFRYCTGEYIVCMDADSQLAPDSVRMLLRRFVHDNIGACAGQVVIRNRFNLLTHLQALEYMLMNGTARMFQSYFSSVLIAPGPLTMFRRSVLQGLQDHWRPDDRSGGLRREKVAGPWESDTFAEDTKLSLSILASGADIVYEPAALCFTSAPHRVQKLLNQRYRWNRGNIQAVRRTWRRWCQNPAKRPSLGIWLIVFMIESILWSILDIMGLGMFLLLIITLGGFGPAYMWYLLLVLVDINAVAFCATNSYHSYGAILLVPVYRTYFGIILQVNALFSLFDELKDRRMHW
jgi:cellulose synthase/poly-beta-1,6-N-acetylglucosamine synthase-like glycosyltransferase